MPQILMRKDVRGRKEVPHNNVTNFIWQVEAEVVLDFDVSFPQCSKEMDMDRLRKFLLVESFNGRTFVGILLCDNDGKAILVDFFALHLEA